MQIENNSTQTGEMPMKEQTELLPHEKGFRVTAIILACMAMVVLIFELLRAFDVLPIGFDLFIVVRLLFSLGEVCEAVALWRKRRGAAVLCIITALVWSADAILDWTK